MEGTQTMAGTVTDLRNEVIEIGRQWGNSQHRLVRIALAVDRSGCWAADGATSAAGWMAGLLDVEACTVREWLRVGRALERLPGVNARFEAGLLSFAKVRVLTRVATSDTEADLIELAESVPAGKLHRAIALWRAGHESDDETDARHQRDRSLTAWIDADGMVCGHFRLPPLDGGTLLAAIETDLMRHRPRPDATTVACPSLSAQRAARALSCAVQRRNRSLRGHPPRPRRRLHPPRRHPDRRQHGRAHRAAAFLRAMIHDAENHPISASARRRHPTSREKRLVDERQPASSRLRRYRTPPVPPRTRLRRHRPHPGRRARTTLRPMPPGSARPVEGRSVEGVVATPLDDLAVGVEAHGVGARVGRSRRDGAPCRRARRCRYRRTRHRGCTGCPASPARTSPPRTGAPRRTRGSPPRSCHRSVGTRTAS